jgi:hypothetical protein
LHSQANHFKAIVGTCHVIGSFVWGAGGGDEKQFVQIEGFPHLNCSPEMTEVYRIERTAKKAYPH